MAVDYPPLPLSSPSHGRTQSTPARKEAQTTTSVYQSDPALIEACLDGSQKAWNELVERYGRLVYSIPRQYGMSPADADEVFQNVFTIVFRRLGSLRDRTRLSAWLITITQRECQRLHRNTKVCDELDESLADLHSPSPSDIQHWEARNLVHHALDQLDWRSQQLLKALFLEPNTPSYRELADRLGMAEGSIAPTRLRCFKKLAAILVAMGFDMSL